MKYQHTRRARSLIAAGCFTALATISGCSAAQNDDASNQATNSASSSQQSNHASTNTQSPQSTSPRTVLTHYFKAIGAGRFDDAYALWRPQSNQAPASAAELKSHYADISAIDVKITGKTHTEGAAGTVYATVPVTVSEQTRSGDKRTQTGQCVLARSNNVPGSAKQDRQWHLHSCDLS